MKYNSFNRRTIAAFTLIILVTLVFSACSKPDESDETSSLLENTNESNLDNDISTAELTVKTPDADILNYKADSAASVSVKNMVISRCLKIESVGEVDGILCVAVQNVSEQDIEYCVLTCKVNGREASFSFSVLPADARAVAQEQNNLQYKNDMSFSLWNVDNRIDFEEKVSLHEDLFEIRCDGNAIEISNKTSSDFTGKITLCYKTFQNENLYGNNAYRVSINGLKIGEVKQLFPKYFDSTTSRVIYVQYEE